MIDREKSEAKEVVSRLHTMAKTHTMNRGLLEQAACLLDSYQAGLAIATPHICSGYALVTTHQRAQLLDIETTAAMEAA